VRREGQRHRKRSGEGDTHRRIQIERETYGDRDIDRGRLRTRGAGLGEQAVNESTWSISQSVNFVSKQSVHIYIDMYVHS